MSCIDRARGVQGHGSHFVVLRDGWVVNGRDPDVFGNMCDALDDEAIYVRVVASQDSMTPAQDTELSRLLSDLEHRYGGKVLYMNEDEL